MNYRYALLESYVGKVFYMDYSEVHVVLLLGGEVGPPFFLCKWVWSDQVYCAEPEEVLVHFDDSGESLNGTFSGTADL